MSMNSGDRLQNASQNAYLTMCSCCDLWPQNLISSFLSPTALKL